MQDEDRVVVIRFGHDWDETCMQMDEVSASCHASMPGKIANSTLPRHELDIRTNISRLDTKVHNHIRSDVQLACVCEGIPTLRSTCRVQQCFSTVYVRLVGNNEYTSEDAYRTRKH